jgi:filamin
LCVAHLEGTQLHGPGVTAAIAGEALTVRMQARDRFGNATAWKRWQTLAVSASGPQEVVFRESPAESGRGVFVARLSRAGAYVVWCTVGGQAVVGWPRVIQVVPGNVDSDASVWRAEAETMALTSELAQHATTGGSGPGEAARMRAEADSLRARLAKYEEAAAVVMEAAEASGVTLVQHARNAAYRTERVERGGRVAAAGEWETTGGGSGSGSLLEPAPGGDWDVAPRGRRQGQGQGQGSVAPGSSAYRGDRL